eukprot:7025340-Prymnesium_polylepis.1
MVSSMVSNQSQFAIPVGLWLAWRMYSSTPPHLARIMPPKKDHMYLRPHSEPARSVSLRSSLYCSAVITAKHTSCGDKCGAGAAGSSDGCVSELMTDLTAARQSATGGAHGLASRRAHGSRCR